MKFRCIYCTHAWECETRPDACPSCATSFSLTVTPDTPILDLAMALDRNGRELDFELRARLPEQHPEHMDVTMASAAMEHRWVTRPHIEWTFCADCNVVQRADGKNRPCRGPVGMTLRGQSCHTDADPDTQPRPTGCSCHLGPGDSP